MTKEIPVPDSPLTQEEKAKVEQLSEAEIQAIDQALLSNASRKWRKVARIIGFTIMYRPNSIRGIPDIFYASRVRELVESGHLESQGDIRCMRFSEVRLLTDEKQGA